jgi:hypothetical protein
MMRTTANTMIAVCLSIQTAARRTCLLTSMSLYLSPGPFFLSLRSLLLSISRSPGLRLCFFRVFSSGLRFFRSLFLSISLSPGLGCFYLC